jgi:hypothetical protein
MDPTERPAPHDLAMLLGQAGIVDRALRANLDGITHEQSLIAPQPAGNCLNWIVGHLVHGYQLALPLVGREPVVPPDELARYARGSGPIDDPEGAWSIEDLLDAWTRSTQRLEDGLRGLSSDDLDRRIDPFGSGREEPLRGHLSFLLFHQAYHVGQAGVLRRVAGEEGAIP